MADRTRPVSAAASAPTVADALAGLIPVAAADAIPAAEDPRGEPVVELVLRSDWDYLPATVVEVAAHHDFAPVELGARTPEHHYAVFVER